jgi:hypothetical protein
MGISNAIFDLGMLSTCNIPQFLKLAQEVLMMTGLILECLWEACTSGAGPIRQATVSVTSHYSSRLLLLLLFFSFGAAVIYIFTYIYTHAIHHLG